MKYYSYNIDGRYTGFRKTSAPIRSGMETERIPEFSEDHTPYFKGDQWEQMPDVAAYVEISIPIHAASATDISVALAVKVAATDEVIETLTETYYVPLVNVMSGQMEQMLTIPVVDGAGAAIFQIANSGVYSIKPDLITPKPTAELRDVPNIAVV